MPQGTPDPSCCDSARPTPISRSSSRRGTPTPASESRQFVPALAALYPTMEFAKVDALASTSDSTSCSWRCRTVTASTSSPSSSNEAMTVVDLGADFRLKRLEDYREWYAHEHDAPQLLASSVYGLVERHRTRARRRDADRRARLLPDGERPGARTVPRRRTHRTNAASS